jgi:hypothetical protein
MRRVEAWDERPRRAGSSGGRRVRNRRDGAVVGRTSRERVLDCLVAVCPSSPSHTHARGRHQKYKTSDDVVRKGF